MFINYRSYFYIIMNLPTTYTCCFRVVNVLQRYCQKCLLTQNSRTTTFIKTAVNQQRCIKTAVNQQRCIKSKNNSFNAKENRYYHGQINWFLGSSQIRHFHSSNNTRIVFAGHSKWSNIKHKKMHKDNARAKVFGKLSLEIIQAVKENGSDPAFNSKLEALIFKAKSCNMPKDKIETSIKNALREKETSQDFDVKNQNTDEKRSHLLVQVRGPGKCGLLVDLLTPNPARSKPELKTILKKNDATFIEDGSVAFMFEHKGVLCVENNLSADDDADVQGMAEEIAITIDAEDVLFQYSQDEEGEEGERDILQFVCPPLQVSQIKKALEQNYPKMKVLSSDTQYLAKTCVSLSGDLILQADRLIDIISDHPDVLQVYDNIENYSSSTIKLVDQYEEFT